LTDPTLRMPNSIFGAVLALGQLPVPLPPLPAKLGDPFLDADWDDESEVAGVYIEFESGQLHLEVSKGNTEHHFHDATGEGDGSSPWSNLDTVAVLHWAMVYSSHLLPVLPALITDVTAAADWYYGGLKLYTRDFGPIPLEFVEVEMEGELFVLPWLGSGHVDHGHIEGDNHPIALLWNPDHDTPDITLAVAWLDPRTETPKARAERGIDWDRVGLPKEEVLAWLEGEYLNEHVIADPALLILHAALDRIAGLDE